MVTTLLSKLDRQILSAVQPAINVALTVSVLITVTVLMLWWIPDLDALAPPGWSNMTANAAICLLLASCSLFSVARGAAKPVPRVWPVQLAAAFVLLVATLTLVEYAAGVSLGLDLWLPHGHAMAHAGFYPGRPSPQTCIGLVLVAAVLLARRGKDGGRSLVPDVATLLLIVMILVQICGRIYGALALQGLHNTIMSPHTLACFACITFTFVMRRAQRGKFFAVLMDPGVGSRVVRTALPAGLLLPLIAFSIEAYIINAGLVSAAMARAIMGSAESFGILCLVTWMGTHINGLERALRHLSLTDELTGVYNRRGFYLLGNQAVLDAARANTGLTLFFFDLDGLKRVNDALGHQAGSDMIKAFAAELVNGFRKSDIIGRLGGDEFAVLTIRDDGIPHHKILAQLARAAADFRTGDFRSRDASSPTLRFSVGHTQLIYGGADTLEAMVKRADALMYLDKRGRQRAGAASAAVIPDRDDATGLPPLLVQALSHAAGSGAA
jgi:diguanylate cyclase (GGDEF)-like protein